MLYLFSLHLNKKISMKHFLFSLVVFFIFFFQPSIHASDFSSHSYEAMLGDSLLKKIPSDTLFRFVKKYGKDSLIHQLDERIKAATHFMGNTIFDIESESHFRKLSMINQKFNLGLDSQIVARERLNSEYLFSLYGKYFKDISRLDEIDKVVKETSNLDSLLEASSYKSVERNFMITFCHQLPWHKKLIDKMYDFSQLTIQLRNEFYWQFYELASKNCVVDSVAHFEYLRSQLKIDALNIASYKDTLLLTDHTNYIEPIKSLAYALYSNDFTIKDGAPIGLLLSTQRVDGGFPKNLLEENGQIISTLFGLWALCEIRDECIATKFPKK